MTKFYALMQVCEVVENFDGISFLDVVISTWKPERHILIPESEIPQGLIDAIEMSPGPSECSIYLKVKMDLSAVTAQDLSFEGPWEISKVRHNALVTDCNGNIINYGVDHIFHEVFLRKG